MEWRDLQGLACGLKVVLCLGIVQVRVIIMRKHNTIACKNLARNRVAQFKLSIGGGKDNDISTPQFVF